MNPHVDQCRDTEGSNPLDDGRQRQGIEVHQAQVIGNGCAQRDGHSMRGRIALLNPELVGRSVPLRPMVMRRQSVLVLGVAMVVREVEVELRCLGVYPDECGD